MKKYKNLSNGNGALFIKALITGSVFGILSIILLLAISAVVFLKSGMLPAETIQYVVLAFNAAGGFIAGYIAARIIKFNGLFWGLIAGITIFILIVIGGLISSASTITIITLYKAIVLAVFGIIGGIKGVNRKEKITIK